MSIPPFRLPVADPTILSAAPADLCRQIRSMNDQDAAIFLSSIIAAHVAATEQRCMETFKQTIDVHLDKAGAG